MGAKPTKQQQFQQLQQQSGEMRNDKSNYASIANMTLGGTAQGDMSTMSMSPGAMLSYSSSYNPYFTTPPHQSYSNMLCLPSQSSPTPQQIQMNKMLQTTSSQPPLPPPPPYASSQSVAFDHWQFGNNSSRGVNPNMNTMSTMNPMNTLTKSMNIHRVLPPYEQQQQVKYDMVKFMPIMPPQINMSQPPLPQMHQLAPPPASHQTLHHHNHHHQLSSSHLQPSQASYVHNHHNIPPPPPLHLQHHQHQHQLSHPHPAAAFIIPYHHSRRNSNSNSSSTVSSSKSSSSFSSMS